MSSPDEAPNPASKKRRLQRGKRVMALRCLAIVARTARRIVLSARTFTHLHYVEDLESRLERMEKFVSKWTILQLVPDTDEAKALDAQHPDGHPSRSLRMPSEQSHASGSRAADLPRTSSPLTIAPPTLASTDAGAPSEDEEAELDEDLTEAMRKLSMHPKPSRYHGKSSGLVFIRSAQTLKNGRTGSRLTLNSDGHQPWLQSFVEDDFPVFEERVFPPRDLLDALVELYFHHMNCHLPLLHEPTFKNAVRGGQHLRDAGFGATVLLVCAIGSRFTRDPRVLLHGSAHLHSAGWKWFHAVEKARRLSFAPAKLHDLQVYALMALFLYGSNAPGGPWAVVGAGVRAALEVGVHRKRMYSPTPNVEEELWRRVFWILVLLEWMLGYGFGRPCSIHDEDFDLALPTECDDEYWLTTEGEPLFKQPPGEPSKVSGFVQVLRLGQILAFANRTIYATNKSRAQLGHSDQQWEQRIVAELDSALNKWSGSLPSHRCSWLAAGFAPVRWNPEQENELFLIQAATIGGFYYLHQIAVHRSFMSQPSSLRESSISPLSTIICVNAARAAIQMIEVVYNRTGNPTHGNMRMVFIAAMVLTRNMLGLKRSGGAANVNTEKDSALVRKSIEMLMSLRHDDILADLASGITDPAPPPGARPNVQEPTSSRAEMGRTPPHGASAEGPNAPVHPGATEPYTYPGLDFDFTLPSAFATPFRSDTFEQGFAMPVDGPIHLGASDQEPLLPALPHAYGLSQGLAQDGPPLTSQPRGVAPTGTTSNERAARGPFGMGTGQVFGLEAVSRTTASGSILWQSPGRIAQAAPQEYPPSYPPDPNHGHLATGGASLWDQDGGIADGFMRMDDALAMWPSMSESPMFRWDEWGGHFAGADGTGT
ncbi:hypothetical protein V8D89_002047 [Ganoderma adspersum]